MGKFLKSAAFYLVKAGIWLAGHPEVIEMVGEIAKAKAEKNK